jgi:hypothetical protein
MMGPLMLGKVHDLDKPASIHLITVNEPFRSGA